MRNERAKEIPTTIFQSEWAVVAAKIHELVLMIRQVRFLIYRPIYTRQLLLKTVAWNSAYNLSCTV
jgi:hypothetical protein